ncbi:MAG TPA: general secretion pathway protein GspB [Gammaproteobacteria bacterium]|nr:general secretion pathway protein GspB [Gammaproteobacteria bacterium]
MSRQGVRITAARAALAGLLAAITPASPVWADTALAPPAVSAARTAPPAASPADSPARAAPPLGLPPSSVSSAAANVVPLKDPMRPYAPSNAAPDRAEGSQRYVLTMVLVAASRRIAVVNGKVLQEGDSVDGAKVVRIEPQRVDLERGKQSVRLALEDERDE